MNKKTLFNFLFICLISCAFFATFFPSCNQYEYLPADPITITYDQISLMAFTDKHSYEEGEEFDPSTVRCELWYYDSVHYQSTQKAVEGWTYEVDDSGEDRIVTIKYRAEDGTEYKTTLELHFIREFLYSIEVDSSELGTSCYVGNTVNLQSLKVYQIYYKNGVETKRILTPFEELSFSVEDLGEHKKVDLFWDKDYKAVTRGSFDVNVNVKWKNLTRSRSFYFTVYGENESESYSFSISGELAKTQYMVGEKFDPTGLTGKIYYYHSIRGETTTQEIEITDLANDTNWTLVDFDGNEIDMNQAQSRYVYIRYKYGNVPVFGYKGDYSNSFYLEIFSGKTLQSISVSLKSPSYYYLNSEINKNNYAVKANFYDDSNNKYETIELLPYEWTAVDFDSSTKGKKELTVSYTYNDETKTAAVEYYIYTIESISQVYGFKYLYIEGESLDKSKISATVVIDYGNNLTTISATDLTITGFDSSTPGEQELTISYSEHGDTVSTKHQIEMKALADIPMQIRGIRITKMPDKTEYFNSEEIDYSGMEVMGDYLYYDFENNKQYYSKLLDTCINSVIEKDDEITLKTLYRSGGLGSFEATAEQKMYRYTVTTEFNAPVKEKKWYELGEQLAQFSANRITQSKAANAPGNKVEDVTDEYEIQGFSTNLSGGSFRTGYINEKSTGKTIKTYTYYVNYFNAINAVSFCSTQYVNEPLYIDNAQFELEYTNGTKKTIPTSSVQFSSIDLSTKGTRDLTVSYTDKFNVTRSSKIPINVVDYSCTVELDQTPVKDYYELDTWITEFPQDYANWKFKISDAHNSVPESVKISDLSLSTSATYVGAVKNESPDIYLHYTYTDTARNYTKKGSFAVKQLVKRAYLGSINLEVEPTKKYYYYEEEGFNSDGLKIAGVYNQLYSTNELYRKDITDIVEQVPTKETVTYNGSNYERITSVTFKIDNGLSGSNAKELSVEYPLNRLTLKELDNSVLKSFAENHPIIDSSFPYVKVNAKYEEGDEYTREADCLIKSGKQPSPFGTKFEVPEITGDTISETRHPTSLTYCWLNSSTYKFSYSEGALEVEYDPYYNGRIPAYMINVSSIGNYMATLKTMTLSSVTINEKQYYYWLGSNESQEALDDYLQKSNLKKGSNLVFSPVGSDYENMTFKLKFFYLRTYDNYTSTKHTYSCSDNRCDLLDLGTDFEMKVETDDCKTNHPHIRMEKERTDLPNGFTCKYKYYYEDGVNEPLFIYSYSTHGSN